MNYYKLQTNFNFPSVINKYLTCSDCTTIFLKQRFAWTFSFLSYIGCTHMKNGSQYMQDVGGNCLGILMEQKNSKVLEDAMGCFFLIRHERKGRDFKLIDFGEYCGLSFVLCLSMPFIHKSVQTLLNSGAMHNSLHSQAIQHKLI